MSQIEPVVCGTVFVPADKDGDGKLSESDAHEFGINGADPKLRFAITLGREQAVLS